MRRIRIAAGMIVVGLLVGMAGWAGQTAGRAKVLGIAYVKLKMADSEKALTFYGGDLRLVGGGVKGHGNKVDERHFALNQYQWLELVTTAPGTRGSYLVEIGFATDDLEKMRAYLTEKGVPADRIQTRWNGVRYFETADPEGNKIAFVEQKRNEAETGTTGAISKKLLHAGFVVKDWKAENRFYEDVLGFHLYWKGGFKDDGLDWYEIQVPDGDNWIEYMLNIPANADHKELGVQNHFSLGVEKASAAGEFLRANGLEEFDGPEIGRDGKNALDVYDPDGTRVELMEFTPTGKTCCSEYMGPHPKP
jgi:catechol 2,3-dioxygenase-like lactoylglutathione lyase family enzyme